MCYPSHVSVPICSPHWRMEKHPGTCRHPYFKWLLISWEGDIICLGFFFFFCYQDFTEGHGNTCAAEAAMTLGFIFHLPCFSVALLQNWFCTDIFIDGMHFFSSLNTKKCQICVSCLCFRDEIPFFYTSLLLCSSYAFAQQLRKQIDSGPVHTKEYLAQTIILQDPLPDFSLQ